MKSLLWALCAVLVLTASAAARAQTSAPQVQVQVEADTVAVGDVTHVQLSVTSTEAMPSDAQIGSAPGFVVREHSASPSQQFMIINGSQSSRYTLTVQWGLQAQRVGTFAVGPMTVIVKGSRFAAQPVSLRVVAQGQAPRRRAPPSVRPAPFGFSFSPFDPWRGLIPGMDGDQETPQAPAVSTDPRLSLDAPRGDYFFLHATVDKTAAAVGEQVTFTVYEYEDLNASGVQVDSDDVHDAQAADFVKHPLVREDQESPLAGFASVGGRTWKVTIVRRWALFPLRSGDLAIGPMRVLLTRPRDVAGQMRTTEPLTVRVFDPPAAGRPPGFSWGDVGSFKVAAEVQPRDIEQGSAVNVHVEVSGTGNVPAAIAPPVREGVEWLTPEVHDDLGPLGQGAYGGKRTFDFVVRVKKAGSVDLGDVTLPYWDPEQKKYNVARAPLGSVRVKAAPMAAGVASPDAELLAGLPSPREGLDGTSTAPPWRGENQEGATVAERHPDDSPLFWLAGVAGGPLAFGAAVAGRASARRVHGAWHRRRISPAAELKERVAAARAACEGGDGRAVDAAITRALEMATVVHAGVGIRGALGAEVVERLERAGVGRAAAASVAELLVECERARFAPETPDPATARDRWARAQEAIEHLEKTA